MSNLPSTECSETRPGGSPPGRSESVDKADAWDAVAAKNAEITRLRAENARLRKAIKRAIRQHEEGNKGLSHRTLCEAVYGEQA